MPTYFAPCRLKLFVLSSDTTPTGLIVSCDQLGSFVRLYKAKSITDLLGQDQSRAQEVLGILRAPEVTPTFVLQIVDPRIKCVLCRSAFMNHALEVGNKWLHKR